MKNYLLLIFLVILIATVNITAQTKSNTPVFMAIKDIEMLVEPGVCWVKVDAYPSIIVTNNSSAKVALVSGLGEDGHFPLGTTVETWKATDENGNETITSFKIIVSTFNDPPSVNLVDDLVINKDSGIVEIPITGISAGNDCEDQQIVGVLVCSSNKEVVTSEVIYIPGDDNGTLKLTPGKTGKANIVFLVLDSGGEENGGSDVATIMFNVEVVESKNKSVLEKENNYFNLKMYPNPAKGFVHIDINGTEVNNLDVSVFSVTGKLVMQQQYKEQENITLNISNQKQGVYFVKLNIDGKETVRKLVLGRQ